MIARVASIIVVSSLAQVALPQGLVPIITANDRLVVFDHGRFREVEPRKPQQLAVVGDHLFYADEKGRLKVYHDKQVHDLKFEGPVELRASNGMVAFTSGSRLGIARAIGPLMLSNDAASVTVSDSLLAWHDRESGLLDLCYDGKVFNIARIDSTGDRPQWRMGRNTFTCFEHAIGTITLFHGGKITTLCDSTDAAIVACGGDVVAYWDDGLERFMAWDHGSTVALDEFKPIDFQVGDGLIAWTDVTMKLYAYQHGIRSRLLDHRPTQYWVRDSLIVFVDQGMFWTVENGKAEVVENYVPEQWSIHQGTIAYLDLNRSIRSWHHGERDDVSRGLAAIEKYEAFGDALLYRDPQGLYKVAWRGRVYEY